jgi:hypothetical protein
MPCVQSRLYSDTRTQVFYTDEEKTILKLELIELNSQIKQNELRRVSQIHAQQSECALRVQGKFGTMPRKKVLVLIVAKTQSGKTGAMIAICKEYKDMHEIQIENIYIITGHSSTSWKKQTKGRFPNCLEKNIYHRPDFNKKGTKNKLFKELENKKNVLIIMDEVHVAAKKGQSVDKFFKKLKFNDLYYCLENDIKIVEFSATPDGTLYDLNAWKQHSTLIKMKPGENYVGADDLDKRKRLFQFKDLCCIDRGGIIDLNIARENINEIKQKMVHFNEPMYHIIRTPTKPLGLQTEVINAFKGIFNDNEYMYIQYNGETKRKEELSGINDILTVKPEKDTFIFIKEMLRMAVTLHKEHLGILYERYTKKPNDSVIVQGLVGRATGYDDNGKTIVFTNIDSIIKYRNLWNGDFRDNLMIQWISNTTKSNGDGGTKSRETFNVPSTTGDIKEDNLPDKPPEIIKFKSQDKLKKWFANELKPKGYGRGPHRKKENDDGFYQCITQDSKTSKVRNIAEFEEIEKKNSWGFKGKTQKSKEKNKYRLYPCYSDTKNKETLQWWFVYY